jgi:hypothetical protein
MEHSATYYRQIAEDLSRRACLSPDPAVREQLKMAAHDYELLAQAIDDEETDRVLHSGGPAGKTETTRQPAGTTRTATASPC